MDNKTRRRFLKSAGGTAICGGLAGCLSSTGGNTDSGLTTVKTMLPIGTVYTAWGKAGVEQGFFEEQGINLQVEYRPYSAYSKAFTSHQVDVALFSTTPALSLINRGTKLVTFGGAGGLLGISGLFTRNNSDIQEIQDLKGKRVGVWSWGSSTVQSVQALITKQTGLQIRQDCKTTTAAPPALKGLLDKGDIDAVVEISSISISMAARPEKYRMLAQLNKIWLELTEHKLPVTLWFAWPEWYKKNTDVAKRLVKASIKTTKYWRENTRDILNKYGEEAKIDDKAEIDLVENWADRGFTLASDVNQEFFDTTWKFFNLMQKHGFLKEVPPQNEVLRTPS
jgi:ABC-type nitrate/sulfonate/bicarbonate transport system substrate-binding protein